MSFVSAFCAFASHEPHTHHHGCSHAYHDDHGQGSGHDHGHEEERLLATSKLLEELTEEEDKSCTDLDFICTFMSILVLCSYQFLVFLLKFKG
ncbi:IAA-alanine resistance protein 1-like [Pyrus ussuriensis x Pyrus communis]|uniref:IAA-alanine resistance protein 1-like n=1 Tax=Pyrus ussuriensis x Pyrus communis TaxID=2448454 RepID=A0A5N5FLV9_9ROSA|nr:IAA-alanine resistance protein 1-like [Pyrus ussuriensis x Pyrus communis]